MVTIRELQPRRPGAASVEFALSFIVLMMFVFGIFEYGRFLMIRQLTDNAAREAARLAASNSGFQYNPVNNTYTPHTLTTLDIQNAFLNAMAGQPLWNSSNQPLTAADISVYRADPVTGNPMADAKGPAWTTCSFGESIAVSVSVKYDSMLPNFHFLTNPDPMVFKCLMRSEASN